MSKSREGVSLLEELLYSADENYIVRQLRKIEDPLTLP